MEPIVKPIQAQGVALAISLEERQVPPSWKRAWRSLVNHEPLAHARSVRLCVRGDFRGEIQGG